MAPGTHDDSDADGDAMDIDEAGPAAMEDQPKRKRFRYSLAEKIRLLNTILPLKEALARSRAVPVEQVMLKDVVKVVQLNSGVPGSTVDKWYRCQSELRETFKDKLSRKNKAFSTGRKAFFPRFRAAVGNARPTAPRRA